MSSENNEGPDLISQLLFTSTCKTRNEIIPVKLNIAIGGFRRELDEFCRDRKHFPVLIQIVGELAFLGQYGFVDWINEEYICSDSTDCNSPAAITFDEVEQMMLDWLHMMKRDFFDKEISVKDKKSAQTTIDEMEYIELWALLTDQWDVDVILKEVQTYLKEMRETLSKVSE